MQSITNYKNAALASLKGNWDKGVITCLIYLVILGIPVFGLSYIQQGLGNLWSLMLLPLSWGYTVYYLLLARKEDLSYERLLDGYKDFARIFITQLLVAIYTLLWTLLLIIPGIIKQYSYAMTPYILKDDPTIKNDAAIEKSMAMMKGYKMKLFLLDLSFIGWIILGILSLGIGLLFVSPYMLTARAHFYEDLKAETEHFIQPE